MSKIDVINTLTANEAYFVGYCEKNSNASLDSFTENVGSGNWTMFARDYYSITGINVNGMAWCDTFQDILFIYTFGSDIALKLLGGWSAYTPTSANYFKNMGRWSLTPEEGSLVFFQKNGTICHIGYVYSIDNNSIYTIEGNTSDMVKKKSYPKVDIGNYIAGFGMPDYPDDATKVTLLNGATLDNIHQNLGNSTVVKPTSKIYVVPKFQEWLNNNFGSLIKRKYGSLLDIDGIYGSKTRTVAFIAWINTLNIDFGTSFDLYTTSIYDISRFYRNKAIVKYGSSGTFVYLLQGILGGLGFYFDNFDGLSGSNTCESIYYYEKAAGLNLDSNIKNECMAGNEVWGSVFG